MVDTIEHDGIHDKRTATGRVSGVQVNLYHIGLEEYKNLSAIDEYALDGKIQNQKNVWSTKYGKELGRRHQQSKEKFAKQKTDKAQLGIKKIESLLLHTLDIDDAIDWQTLKFADVFSKGTYENEHISFDAGSGQPLSVKDSYPAQKPQEKNYFLDIGFLYKLFGQEEKIQAHQQIVFDRAIEVWKEDCLAAEEESAKRHEKLKELQSDWNEEKRAFDEKQAAHNTKIDELEKRYVEKDVEAVTEYCEMVLNNSQYPPELPKKFELQFNPANGMLLVDFRLPSLGDLPKISTVRYIKARDEAEEKFIPDATRIKLYDSCIYQIALRTIHEIFEADKADAISSVNFNGLVTEISPVTGHKETVCIVSLQAQKEEFEAINLGGIVTNKSYKECFKSLKGIGSTKLSTMTAVKPLLEFDKSDKRFTESYDVTGNLDESVNLASMDWEDFEHLVRELFAQEFAQNGGEVKVTQASRDGGVDAIAFDPDPIRGGKIVIQAKRYTNVVGVAAVRELLGTVHSEGAIKGILVTTSDYGADSYSFAKDKPLTLLSGANLLHLLEKHGHRAKIDIKEAKETLKEQEG